MSKNYVLYSPLAGYGTGEIEARSLERKFSGENEYLNVLKMDDYETFFNGLTAEDKIVLCGGDGTLTQFVRRLNGRTLPCEILYHASGSGNDFLRDIGKTKEDCPVKINEYLEDLPVVTVNGKEYPVLNGVGFGIDGYCCEVGDRERLKSDKPVNYTAIAIKGLLFHFKPRNAVITVDGTRYEYKKVWLAPTMHGGYYGGGMWATPNQKRNNPDGTVSTMLFYGKGRLRTLISFPSIFSGEHVKKTKMVAVLTGKNIEVEFDKPTPLQIDGETILDVTKYSIRSGK